MNNARLWLVVKPTVGLPLFLGGVAITSLLVHTAVLNNTTWVAAFFSGGDMKAASASIEAPVVQDLASGQPATIVMPDGRTAQLVYQ